MTRKKSKAFLKVLHTKHYNSTKRHVSLYMCVSVLSGCITSSEVIVGVNKYKLEREEPVEVRAIDNSTVLEIQVIIHTH